MVDLYKFHINPYDDRLISLNQLITFSGLHLQRMIETNPGVLLNTRITATTTALVALDNTMASNQTKLALRMGRVQAKETFRRALPANLQRIHGAVIAAFGPDSVQETECFPQGRSGYNDCTDEQLNDKLVQLQSCLAPMAAQVGQAHLDNLGGLISTWTALLAAVKTASAGKTGSESARRAARAALQLELFKNLLTLAVAFPNDMEKAKFYYPQHLLERPASQPEEGGESAAA